MQKPRERQTPAAGPRRARWAGVLLALASLWFVSLAGPASAQYVTPNPPQAGVSADIHDGPAESVKVKGADDDGATGKVASRSSGPSLPVTGSDVLGLTAIGFGAIVAGGLILRFRRRAVRT